MSTVDLSPYQEAVLEAVEDNDASAPHLAVQARAGSGKTFTNVEAIRLMRGRVCAVAFNKVIRDELAKKVKPVSPYADVLTLHSVGYRSVLRNLGRQEIPQRDAPGPTRARIDKRWWDEERDYKTALCKLVSMVKNTGVDHTDAAAVERCGLRYVPDGMPEMGDPARDVFVQRAMSLLDAALRPAGLIEYDDMVWLPHVLDLRTPTYEWTVVDEAQDLNAPQLSLAAKLVGRGRLLAVGDDRQAIYGFRGAASDAFGTLVSRFEAEVLPLPICYRCDRAIVELAQAVVPDLQARTDAGDGVVREGWVSEDMLCARPGDFVISRSKAPLLELCLGLIKAGTPATIVGSDIGGSLVALVRQSKKASTTALLRWLDVQCDKVREKFAGSDDPDAASDYLDRAEALHIAAEGTSSCKQVREKIERLFTDKPGAKVVRCSTTHKSKGLEANRVFMLADTYRKRPGREEENLYYVAVTRAKHELRLMYRDDEEAERAEPRDEGNPCDTGEAAE